MIIRTLIFAFAMTQIGFPAGAAMARTDDQTQGLAARQKAFAQWRSGHPKVEAEIADLKAKTAAATGSLPPLDQSGLDRPSVTWKVAGALSELWDDQAAPRMVMIPAGEFTMGAPENEPGRNKREDPRHRVRIAYPFAVAKYEITVAEFARFVAETGYDAGSQCFTFEPKGEMRRDRDWRHPAITQAPAEPVVCVTWDGAQAYAAWLSKKTGHRYRLMSDAEYEYANRAGTTTAFWWGDDVGKGSTNCDGCLAPGDYQHKTMPVGSFPANPFGLSDMTGNAWSWVQDCWNPTYDGAPTDGSPAATGQCDIRIIRGGGWHNDPSNLRSASRVWSHPGHQDQDVGFRLARTL